MSKVKLLVAEDDPDVIELYSAGLSETVFEKRYAKNGKEVLAIYLEWNPDIILLDIWMPVMTGYLVLQEIRAARQDKSTTIVMSTSASNSQDIRDCIQFNIQGYILKPFKIEELSSRIVQYHQQHQSGWIGS